MAEMVMITGYSTVDSATEAFKTGVFDYVPKPFTLEKISSVAEKALETKERIAKEKQEEEEKHYERKKEYISGR